MGRKANSTLIIPAIKASTCAEADVLRAITDQDTRKCVTVDFYSCRGAEKSISEMEDGE